MEGENGEEKEVESTDGKERATRGEEKAESLEEEAEEKVDGLEERTGVDTMWISTADCQYKISSDINSGYINKRICQQLVSSRWFTSGVRV